MIEPTPLNQLPNFNSGGDFNSQPGSNKWLPYIIVGGVLLVALGVSIAINRTNDNRIKLKSNNHEK